MNIDWQAIRPLNGSRHEAFEELCCRIGNAQRPADALFTRKGKPDAGVECFVTFDDGREWAWQAKYFDVLRDTQWKQLDKSVKTALEKHPQLTKYFVCVPMDRADARLENQTSALQKWNDRVTKWSGWASAKGMAVEFVWWGASELLGFLQDPKHAGRVRFWFDKASFDDLWFKNRLNEALKAAGPRYTPELHVDLPIAQNFRALLREADFFDAIRNHAIPIRKELRWLRFQWQPKKPTKTGGVSPQPTPPKPLTTTRKAVDENTSTVLASLAALMPSAAGPLALRRLTDELSVAGETVTQFAEQLMVWERTSKAKADRNGRSPQADERAYARRLVQFLETARRDVDRGLRFLEAQPLVVTGPAGSGKTHLMCDIVKRRIEEGAPALLVLGNQLLSDEDPWIQILQRLDLAGLSADEFVGALEAAAQSRGRRALLVIDALNEGAGRKIWPEHIASFLERLSKSEWINVVLTVRSSYVETILGNTLPATAVSIEHPGFSGRGYEAMKTFFAHYQLELPSTPLLAPEFTNPLFLKVLCSGLADSGQKTLPRGLDGISATFDQYLGGLNKCLAKNLNFNPAKNLVQEALEKLVGRFVDTDQYWLNNTEAEQLVNALLPTKGYQDSLFRALLSEGVLMEDRRHGNDVVQVGYERLSDHLAVSKRLDAIDDFPAAFRKGGGLHFVGDSGQPLRAGQLEALCIQVPERAGKELATLAPGVMDRRDFGSAFSQSLVWRKPDALGADGLALVTKGLANEDGFAALVEPLLTVATLPGHPLNAEFLDRFLSGKQMADRDATWSIALHRVWKKGQGDEVPSVLHRFIDWAWSITPEMQVKDETLMLAGLVLGWTLSCPNRFLRDRATKALVALFAGRLDSFQKLLGRFSDVDDLYVQERLMAAAYGVALNTNDNKTVGPLAQYVYDAVFADSPPVHILLRDYARGVIERGVALGAPLDGDLARVRPPYESTWPHIPTEEEVAHLRPNWEEGTYDCSEPERSKNRIEFSIFDDDFSTYVIGTNHKSNWLDLPLSDPQWLSSDERERALAEEGGVLWRLLEQAHESHRTLIADRYNRWLEGQPDKKLKEAALDAGDKTTWAEVERFIGADQNLAEEEAKVDKSLAVLRETLSPEAQQRLDSHFDDTEESEEPRSFPPDRIQRYVLWRVFDLGWTVERFGHFDRFDVSPQMRESSKPERIGKKYQWLALHEIRAFIADHYQYRERYSSPPDTHYDGPWQESFRDIHPSALLRAKTGGAGWDGHQPSWWAPATYGDWEPEVAAADWIHKPDDLIPELLSATAEDGSRWLNLDGYFGWQSPVPSGVERSESTHRDLWYLAHAYLVRGTGEDFLEWAETVPFTGRWMPDPTSLYQIFLGEHVWSPAAKYFSRPESGSPEWSNPGNDCPLELASTSLHWLHETGGFDCSTDEGYTLKLPSPLLVRSAKMSSRGAARFVGPDGELIAFDPSVQEDGPASLLVRADAIEQLLADEEGLSLCWCVIGEKREMNGGYGDASKHTMAHLWGAYVLDGGSVRGFLKASTESRRDYSGPLIYDIRTPRE